MTKEIIEGNKLIALFDGYQETGKLHPFDATKGITLRHPDKAGETWVAELKYHSSWDWLLPVMQKICELGYAVQWTVTDGASCRIWPYLQSAPSCCIIEDRPYTAIVKFIQWYNKNKPQ